MSTTKWNIDPTHSSVGFKVKHMMFTNVKGQFEEYTSEIETPENGLENAKLNFTAKIASVNTRNQDRDTHLASADFFDSEKFPELKFTTSSVTGSGSNYKLNGHLELHGVTKPVTLDVEFSGLMQDPWENTKAGLSINGKINRKDWGLTYNSALETGGVLIGEDVNLDIELQLIKS